MKTRNVVIAQNLQSGQAFFLINKIHSKVKMTKKKKQKRNCDI